MVGLKDLHKLTSGGNYGLQVDLRDFSNNCHVAVYEQFKVKLYILILVLGCILLNSAFWTLALPNLCYALVRCPTGWSFVLAPLYWSYSWLWQPLIGGSIGICYGLELPILLTFCSTFQQVKDPSIRVTHYPLLYFTAQVAEKNSTAKCFTHLRRCIWRQKLRKRNSRQ